MKITHLSIYQIANDKVFDNVNSYSEMNASLKNHGELVPDDYNNRVGMPFEIFTQFFCMKYGSTPLLGINNVIDTSDDAFTSGYDFMFTDTHGNPGMIQSKWRGNSNYQFKIGELSTSSELARVHNISSDNNILFINIDDTKDLFNYKYEYARIGRRIIGRQAQEEFILRDNNFWNEFRQCIKESSISEFSDPYNPRDIQDWIMNGKDDYEGTISVLNGKYNKGKVEASTGAGKTLCQYYNILDAFNKFNKSTAVMILPTISLITQTFIDFYQHKMFGYTENEARHYSNISCLIIMSGSSPRFDNQITRVKQTLNPNEASEFIQSEISLGRKVLIFTTMKSHGIKYSSIVKSLKDKGIKIGLEIVDEYHNIISTSAERKDQLEIAHYLQNNSERTDGSIFYSASNKDGQILSSFNEDLFGKLLCKVTRNDLRIRGYVCPKLVFKIIKVKSLSNSSEIQREASREGLDINKAQSESVGIIMAYNDAKKYYTEPNIITFGDHVPGCRYIANEDEQIKTYLPGVKNYSMDADTKSSDRTNIINNIKSSGNNILHQHSVAKEGINIPNLHAGVVGRGLSIIALQQAIGRSDRALYEDTLKLQKGEINLDNPVGWSKYYNLIYVIIDDNDETFSQRCNIIIQYLLDSGIPKEEWDISEIHDDARGGTEYIIPEFATTIATSVKFDPDKFKTMLESAKIEVMNHKQDVEDNIELDRIMKLNDDDFVNLFR